MMPTMGLLPSSAGVGELLTSTAGDPSVSIKLG